MYRIFYKESFFQYLKPSPFLLNIYPNVVLAVFSVELELELES